MKNKKIQIFNGFLSQVTLVGRSGVTLTSEAPWGVSKQWEAGELIALGEFLERNNKYKQIFPVAGEMEDVLPPKIFLYFFPQFI